MRRDQARAQAESQLGRFAQPQENWTYRCGRLVAWRAASLVSPDSNADDLSGLPQPLAAFFAIDYSHADICNGGFHQYYYNHTGDLAPYAIRGFRSLGEEERAELMVRSMARFPGGVAPTNREERIAILETIDYADDWRPWVDEIERAYYEVEGTRPMETVLAILVDAHPDVFFLPEGR